MHHYILMFITWQRKKIYIGVLRNTIKTSVKVRSKGSIIHNWLCCVLLQTSKTDVTVLPTGKSRVFEYTLSNK